MQQVYKKRGLSKMRTIIRYSGLAVSLISLISLLYITFPFISWKIYFEPEFTSNSIQTPIPKATVLSKDNIQTLIANAVDSFNLDYTDARNWFPQYKPGYIYKPDPGIVTTFNISIPRLKIKFANVSTIDTDLSKHLILYPGTVIPPNIGNAVIFGHSTIPNWFNPSDYKTIFATLHTLKTGDQVIVTTNTKEYKYKVVTIKITTAQDTSVFAQDTDGSYLTLVTCTPPGTTWKRLIVKARMEK